MESYCVYNSKSPDDIKEMEMTLYETDLKMEREETIHNLKFNLTNVCKDDLR